MDTFRRTCRLAALGLGLLLAMPAARVAAQGGYYNDDRYDDNYDGYSASYQDFYDALSPYGEWIDDPQYGYVWVPDVDQRFRPYYTNGYWVMTNYGNTWVSGYPWGWATFHYGRWTYDSYYGWVWIPGNEWAPAWVDWRSVNDGYYGWAPMGPGAVNYYSNNYYGNSSWWVFAPQQYLYSTNFYNYIRSPRYNSDYLRRSSIIRESRGSDQGRYFTGPRRADVERAIGRSVPVYNINNARRAGRSSVANNTVNIFRPRIDAETRNAGGNVRPREVSRGELRPRETPQTQQAERNGGVLPVPERLRPGRNDAGSGIPPQGPRPQPGRRNDNNDNRDQVRQQQEQIRQQQRQDQVRRQQEQIRQQQQRQQRDQQQIQQRQQMEQQRQQMEQQQIQQRQQQDQQRQQQRQQQEQQRQQQMQQRQQMEQQRQQQMEQRQQQEQQRQQQMQQRQQMEQQRQQQMQQRQQMEQQRQQQIPQRREDGERRR